MKEVAVVLAGDKFDPALHIIQIYTNLHANCTDFRLTVFTDRDDVGLPGVRIIKLPDWNLHGPRQLWWYKVYMFSPQTWTGPVFYMDRYYYCKQHRQVLGLGSGQVLYLPGF